MQKITYADLHCDSVTVCCDGGGNMSDFDGQTNIQKLISAGCAAQCFALFTEGENSSAQFKRYAEFYVAQIASDPRVLPVKRFADIAAARKSGRLAAILTVENMGFLNGDAGGIKQLKELGVQMASLVWNTPNAFAYPNLVFVGDMPDFSLRETRGLTAAGKNAVEELNANRIIIDISHLSDGGADDVLKISSAPVVASHSDCFAVHPVSRNLTDEQLKIIAGKGGVVGLNFCRDFVGGEDVFDSLYRHYKYMVEVGGEELPALGSDFDGIPPYEELRDCLKVQALLEYFASRGVTHSAIEKLAFGNFARVFEEVVG